jgi:hypothetical protein
MNAITSAPERPLHGVHASAAAITLRQALAAAHGPLRDAVAAYRAASAAFSPDADLLVALRAAGSIVIAAESIAEAAKQAEAAARAALAQAMSETGCPAVALANHVVHLSTKPARVDIEDESAIPATLMRQPMPDRVAIGRLLRTGADVPGARLISSNESICVFRSR